MWQLYQFPLCPFSRKVRLLLGEKGVGYTLVRENPWERRDEFIDMNPAGQTPVIADAERDIRLIDSLVICEYFDETVDKAQMINGTAVQRAEIRRLSTWFDTYFFRDVTEKLLGERMIKRIITKASPDAKVLREAMKAGARISRLHRLSARPAQLDGGRDLEPRRSGGGGADFGGRLSRRDRLAQPRGDRALVFGDEEPARASARY